MAAQTQADGDREPPEGPSPRPRTQVASLGQEQPEARASCPAGARVRASALQRPDPQVSTALQRTPASPKRGSFREHFLNTSACLVSEVIIQKEKRSYNLIPTLQQLAVHLTGNAVHQPAGMQRLVTTNPPITAQLTTWGRTCEQCSVMHHPEHRQ